MKTELKKITAPVDSALIPELRAGDRILLSGSIITGRDAAHKRMVDIIKSGEALPFSIENEIIYYVGPTPASPGRPIGAAGPTTAYRMDAYAPLLIEKGLKGMIGKGQRSDIVKEAMAKWGAVYFTSVGGAGALISQRIKKAIILAWEDLGTEAVRRLEIEDLPLVVATDVHGGDLYLSGPAEYRRV